jgi:C1A family cysteine protease
LIAKNSFGKSWGDNGYVAVKIDTSKDGVCGILK